jgi:hypothetical protein
MSRAGREPAEDVKRRLKAACEEVGLNVPSARMHLLRDEAVRVIHVEANLPGWRYEVPTLSLMATVGQNGSWSRRVDVRCHATEDDPLLSTFRSPVMQGRGAVPVEELVDQLRETLEERDQVIAAAKLGIPGPYRFARSEWKVWSPGIT